jgi:hypothetical protein
MERMRRKAAYEAMDALFSARLAERRWESAWARGDQRAADRQARIAAGAMARYRALALKS